LGAPSVDDEAASTRSRVKTTAEWVQFLIVASEAFSAAFLNISVGADAVDRQFAIPVHHETEILNASNT
jgi:hypothetical protein